MRLIIPLTAGYLLDLLLGDPAGWPHPIRLFGWLIAEGETRLNKHRKRFLKGTLLTLTLCAVTFTSLHLLLASLWELSHIAWYLSASLFVFYGLAHRQLIREGKKVFKTLQDQGLEAGRLQLSHIVGRDTRNLSAAQIRIAVMETLSENLSDGVVAPLFYYACAGVPGMMTYKMINTLDSMIGHRTDRFELFGKFAARLDDVANFIPARLTALLMAAASFSKKSFQFIVRYGHQHKSHNAGYPEAALAGILDVQFGGTNIYHGLAVKKPYIGNNSRELSPEEIKKAIDINHRVCLLTIVLIIVTAVCLNIS